MTMAVFFGIYSAHRRAAGLSRHARTRRTVGPPGNRVTASRPDIVDRNGEVLATDIKTSSLFAEPRRIVDADEAIEKLSTVLPDIDYEQTYNKLKSGAGFVWLQAPADAQAAERHHDSSAFPASASAPRSGASIRAARPRRTSSA